MYRIAFKNPTNDLEQRAQTCTTYTETVCDGGDSSCMECDGGDASDGSTSGGGSSGTPETNETTVTENGITFPTCVSSFDFVKIQEAFYTEVLDISHSYLLSNNIWEEYDIANLCIQVRDRNALGQYISADQANKMV